MECYNFGAFYSKRENISKMENNTEMQVSKSRFKTGILLFWIYLKSMAFAFTGGMAAIPLIQFDLVKKYKMIADDDFVQIIALSHALPGIIGLNNSILTGYKIAGVFGALMCSLGTIFPAFTAMLVVAVIFQKLPQSKIVKGAILGIRAISVAVILDVAIRIVMRFRKNAFGLSVILVAFAIPLITGLSSFYAILLSGLIGVLYVSIKDQPKKRTNTKEED